MMTAKVLALIFLVILMLPGISSPATPDDSVSQPGGEPVQFLFIHHSCGGQLLADKGGNNGNKCIYVSHPNGGGLRSRLEGIGFEVNEASYGSIVGDETDICHWNSKFRNQMDRIVKTKNQDELLPEGIFNNIVAFKSCYPNNHFSGEGSMPGDPDSCQLTLANAKAAYKALLPYFKEQPDVLFVAFTAPPLAKTPGFKAFVKNILKGPPKHPELARQFNNWLMDKENGWQAGYDLTNIAVFDHYNVLTDEGKTNWSAYPSGGGGDSHPNSEGNAKAADAFIGFIQETISDRQRSEP